MISVEELRTIWQRGDDETRLLVGRYLNDPFHSFRPRPDAPEEFDQQFSFVNDRWNGIACVIAGNASGKTYSSTYKAAKFLRETPPPTDLCKYFVASQTMAMVGALWQEKMSHFIPEELIEHVGYWDSNLGHPATVIMRPSANGNRWMLCFRSYEQGRKSYQGISQCAGYLLDEQLPSLSLLNEIDTRTRECDYPGSKIYSLTPLEPDEDLQERMDDCTKPGSKFPFWKFYRMNAEKNYEAGGLATLQWLLNTPEEMRETRRIGDFCLLSGAVFKEFDDNIHVIEPRELSREAVYFRSIDFGFSVDTHCLLMAEDRGVTYVVKEWHASGMRIEDKVAKTLREMPGEMTTYADPEDAQQRHEFLKLGLPTTIARKEVRDGIDRIKTMLAKRKLLFFKGTKKVVSQMKNYRWKEPKKGGEDLRVDRPVKRNDHGVDALRMGIDSREKSPLTAWEAAKIPIGPVSRV